jgi:hypothetical protein
LSDRDQRRVTALVHRYGAARIVEEARAVPQPKPKRKPGQSKMGWLLVWENMEFANTIESLAFGYYHGERNRYQQAYAEALRLYPNLANKSIAALERYHRRGRNYWIAHGKRGSDHVPAWVQNFLKADMK